MTGRAQVVLLGEQFIRFSAVGVIGTLAHYAAMAVLVVALNTDPVFSSAVGFVIGAIVNYLLNYRYTFRSGVAHWSGFPRFMTIALIGLFLNSGIMALATWELGVNVAISQVAATGLVLLWNFAGNKIWTFRDE